MEHVCLCCRYCIWGWLPARDESIADFCIQLLEKGAQLWWKDTVGVAEPGFEDRSRSQDRIRSYIRNLRRSLHRKRFDSAAAPTGNDGGGFIEGEEEEDPAAIDTAGSKQAADSLDKMEGELMGFLNQLSTEFDRLRREKSKALRKGLPFSEGDEAELIASQRNLAGLFCMWFEPLSLTTQVRSLAPEEIWPRYEQWMYCAYPLVREPERFDIETLGRELEQMTARKQQDPVLGAKAFRALLLCARVTSLNHKPLASTEGP